MSEATNRNVHVVVGIAIACCALAGCLVDESAASDVGDELEASATSSAATIGGAAGSPSDIASVAAAATAPAWRPFNSSSVWNTPIAANAALEADSKALIADLAASSPYGPHLDVNMQQFSVPMFFANASTPKVRVRCNVGGFGFTGTNGINATAMVPIPANAAPDAANDHHMLIIDQSTNTEWGMGKAVKNGNEWTCGTGATLDLNGTGQRPIMAGNRTWWTSHGPRACSYGLAAGLITREQVASGAIEHALVIAYPHIRAGLYTQPASTAQARIGTQAIKTRGIPCGGRVQLDPSIDVNSLGLSATGRIIATALQKYGAFVGDYSGGISLYAENSAEAKAGWQGVLTGRELRNLDLTKLRVLKIGTLYDNGNGG